MNNNDIQNPNGKNPYLIGSSPEIIKKDIIMFKEEVLVELKQLDKSLAQKYSKMSQEVKDKLDVFDKKLNNFNVKLSDLSTKLILDLKSHEKLSELLIFKEKAQDMINSNKVKITLLGEEVRDSTNRIDSLLKESVVYPGIIGNLSKFKNFHEFIDYILLQISLMNNFKEKNNIDFGVYKQKTTNTFNTLKLKLDSVVKEANIYSADSIQTCERKLLKEIEYRDEKIKDTRIENHELISKLTKDTKEFVDDYNKIKELKTDINNELKIIKQNNIDYINHAFKGYNEKYNTIEKKISDLNKNIKNTMNYLNQEGIELNSIKNKNDENKNIPETKNIKINEKINEQEKKEKVGIVKNKQKSGIDISISVKNYDSDSLTLKSKKGIENLKNNKLIRNGSDIAKYVKGEILANDIGSMTKSHHKIFKSRYQKARKFGEILEDEHKNDLNKENDLYKNRNKDKFKQSKKNVEIFNVNDMLDISYEKPKMLKKEKMIKANNKNYIDIELKDLDVQYHGNQMFSTLEYKNINSIEEIMNDYNKQNNNNNLNFKTILENMNFNSPIFSNLNNIKSSKSNNNGNKNVIFNYKSDFNSQSNLHKFNKNSSFLNFFSPITNKNNQLILTESMLNLSNKRINPKNNNLLKLKISKSLKNVIPLDLNSISNNNNDMSKGKNRINSALSYNAKTKTNKNYIDNISNKTIKTMKTLINKNQIFPSY